MDLNESSFRWIFCLIGVFQQQAYHCTMEMLFSSLVWNIVSQGVYMLLIIHWSTITFCFSVSLVTIYHSWHASALLVIIDRITCHQFCDHPSIKSIAINDKWTMCELWPGHWTMTSRVLEMSTSWEDILLSVLFYYSIDHRFLTNTIPPELENTMRYHLYARVQHCEPGNPEVNIIQAELTRGAYADMQR